VNTVVDITDIKSSQGSVEPGSTEPAAGDNEGREGSPKKRIRKTGVCREDSKGFPREKRLK